MNKRINLFDSLKGIAIVGIFCIHIGVNNCIFNGLLYKVFCYGNRGVELTYIVTSILLSFALYKENLSCKDRALIVIERIKKIIPIYYLFIIISFIIKEFLYKNKVPFSAWIYNFLFLNVFSKEFGNYPGGSLYFSCLIFSSLLYAIYINVLINRRKIIFLIDILIEITFALFIPRILYNRLSLEMYSNICYLCRCISSFSVGNIIYLCINNKNVVKKFSKLSNVLKYIFSILLIIIYILLSKLIDIVICTHILIFANVIINIENSIKLIDNKIFSFLGKRITCIFCTHILINDILGLYLSKDILYFILVAILTLLFSEILYRINKIMRNKVLNISQ